MRIACVHIPQLSLQCVTRVEPSLRGAALVVVGASVTPEGRQVLTAPIVLACSRAAWALGVRLGMTAVTARSVSPDVRVVHSDASGERETVRALADALLALSPTVDVGGRLGSAGAHLAMYVEVPAKTRGTSFGERVLDLAAGLGLQARVGIADDRFTAWVAASSPTAPLPGGGNGADDPRVVVSVPRGGGAAYLSPRPLSLLSITPEVQHMLEALGVRTLGEFASLPAPSVARPIDRDYQALARGDGGTALRPYAPEASIREEISLSGIESGLNGIEAVSQLARRIALRLAGRGRLASKLEIVGMGHDGEHPVPLDLTSWPAKPLGRDDDLAEAIAQLVVAGMWRLRVVVTGEIVPSEAASVAAAQAATYVVANDEIAAHLDPHAGAIDMLGLVLASPGTGDLFGGGLFGSEAREAPRRMRRGKRRSRMMTSPAQSRLFERS